VRARRRRWERPLGQVVRRFGGAERFAARLSRPSRTISGSAVRHWVAERACPPLDTALEIVRISEGALRIEDLCKARDRS